jgi:pimeloyl-ACP methyl ester carboxylesterase
MHQHIQYCTASDGVRLAYSVIGKGTPIVRASQWLTHLEYDLKSPVSRDMVMGLSHRHILVRYDARGEGLSQRDVEEMTFARWISDLECVVDTLALERFALLGVSQGSSIAIQYAVKHPERVSHLILFGGFARGHLHRENPEKQRQFLELSRTLVRQGWGSDQDAYRQWFTSQFIPESTAEEARWFNELERVSGSPDMAERFMLEVANINIVDLLPKVKVPTLVLHVRGDLRAPFSLGEELATKIPGAKFVPLDGKNHVLLAREPAFRSFLEAVADFLGDPPIRGELPGKATFGDRLNSTIKSVEQSWFIKLVFIFAAITGVVIFFIEMWTLWHSH